MSQLPSTIFDENGNLDSSSLQLLSETQVNELNLLKERKKAL
jgi:hypothetical protein